MPKLILQVNTKAVNAAGGETRMRDTVDVWEHLPQGIKASLTSLLTRLPEAVQAKYGEDTVIEGMNLIADPVPEQP